MPPPRKFAKYPLENKLYHGVIILCGLSVILTGVFMMFRVRTILFPRNPYLFSDMTWGLMYVLHGLAGVGLIALVIVHVYFAVRPEKLRLSGERSEGFAIPATVTAISQRPAALWNAMPSDDFPSTWTTLLGE